MRYFDSSETAAVPAKKYQPFMLHQSPWRVPFTRRMKATPLPVSSALAGHAITRRSQKVRPNSISPAVPSETRICAIESSKPRNSWPRTCSDEIVPARCRRGSRMVGSNTGYSVLPMRSDRDAGPVIVEMGPPSGLLGCWPPAATQRVADLGEQGVLVPVVDRRDARGGFVRRRDPVHDPVAVLGLAHVGDGADAAHRVAL